MDINHIYFTKMSYLIDNILTILLVLSLLLHIDSEANLMFSFINQCSYLCFNVESCIKQCEHGFKSSSAQNKLIENFRQIMPFSGNTFSSPPECGLRSKRKLYRNGRGVHWRVVGGKDVLPHEFPWIVSFQMKKQKLWGGYELIHFCGGTIINERYVVTAAHCLDQYLALKDRMVLKVGINYLSDTGQQLHPEKLIIHENWNVKYKINDIALVKVKEKIQFKTNNRNLYLVNSICLNQNPKEVSGYASISGWGQLGVKLGVSNWLQTLRVPVWQRNHCAKTFVRIIEEKTSWIHKLFGIIEVMKIKDTHICAGGKGGEDVCMGDSGGPLMQVRNGRSYLIGVVSFTYPCAIKGIPGVYTNVFKYINWIKNHAK